MQRDLDKGGFYREFNKFPLKRRRGKRMHILICNTRMSGFLKIDLDTRIRFLEIANYGA